MAHEAPDGGYGWVIVGAGFFGCILQGSVFSTMTLMYQALIERFGMDAANTGSLGALFVTVSMGASKCAILEN